MVAAIAGVATVAGAAISSSAAGDAADTQAQASQQSNALQQAQYQQNVALQMPTINTGNAARDRLSMLLGLSPASSGGGQTINGLANNLTRDQVRQQLMSQYTRTSTTPAASGGPDLSALMAQYPGVDPKELLARFPGISTGLTDPGLARSMDQAGTSPTAAGPTSTSQLDDAGLNAAVDKYFSDQQAQQDAIKNNPEYGRLAQQFQFDTYTPDKFSYTGEDLYNDPSYQFRLEQGQKALDRSGAAAGRFLSGRQLQGASDYNQGAASQEFQSAYQRALGTFSTNEGNRANAFNTNEGNRFNAYQANFNNAVNPLLSLAGAATLGSQNLGNAGAASAALQGNTLTNQANATGAAGIASANAISSGLNSAATGYQNNQLLSSILGNKGSVNNNPAGPGLGGLDSSTVYGAGSGWGNA